MKYMWRTVGYTWTDYKTNAQIAKELKITPILDKLLEYKRRWMQHVNRMPRNRFPRVTKYYSPAGRRNHDRPLKRLLDTWDRNGLTSGPTPWKIYDDDDVILACIIFTICEQIVFSAFTSGPICIATIKASIFSFTVCASKIVGKSAQNNVTRVRSTVRNTLPFSPSDSQYLFRKLRSQSTETMPKTFKCIQFVFYMFFLQHSLFNSILKESSCVEYNR